MKLQWAYKLKTEDEKTISTLRKVRAITTTPTGR